MEISQTSQNGKFSINLQDIDLSPLLITLPKQSCNNYNDLKSLAAQGNILIQPFSNMPNLIKGNPELGFIYGGFMADKVILYKDFFISFGAKNHLAYYSKVSSNLSTLKMNSIVGEYFNVKFTSDEKKNIKAIIKQSIDNFKHISKKETEETQLQFQTELNEKLSTCLITTTPSLEGFKILEYFGTVSSFSVLKLDIVREFFANLGDIWGGKSKGYMKKYQDLQNDVEGKLKYYAIQKGGNAVIGAKFDVEFIETSTGRKEILGTGEQIDRKMLISGSGTAVSIVKII